MKHLLTVILVLASLCANSQTLDKTSGNIKGNVTEQNGNPVFDATVYAVPQDLTLDGITPRSVQTDRKSAFDFTGGLPWGHYKLYACKSKDGCPSPLDSFYADSQVEAVKAELREDSPSAEVTVNMGEKAGIITGRVLDADTGGPVEARVVFRREDGEGGHAVTSRSKDGEYRVLLPPGKDVMIAMVHIEPGDRSLAPLPTLRLRLEPAQQIVLDIPISSK